MINDHKDLNDQSFLIAFKECTLDPSLFSHEAHLRLAYLHLKQSDVGKASEEVSQQLLNYVRHLGAENKFNKTVTIASVKAVDHFVKLSKSNNFQDFIIEFPQLLVKFRSLLASHYSFDVFNSSEARQRFMEPDIQSF